MNDILHDPSVAAVGPVGSEGGRSPSTHSTAAVVPAGGLALVLRLLRGDSAESLSRALGVPLYRLEGWRERALSGIDGSLREREGDAVSEELAAAMKRIGELTMRMKCCGRGWGMLALWPGGGRGNGRRDLAWRRSSLRGCPCV